MDGDKGKAGPLILSRARPHGQERGTCLAGTKEERGEEARGKGVRRPKIEAAMREKSLSLSMANKEREPSITGEDERPVPDNEVEIATRVRRQPAPD
jgi:hypothetical protein